MPKTMQKWSGRDYIGKRFDNYFVLYTHHRDSGVLDESNFRSIRKYLDAHPHVSYLIVPFNQWAVGWIEQILISETDGGSVSFGNKIIEKLEGYPIFNEDDFSDLEWENIMELRDMIRTDINNLDADEELTGRSHITKGMTDEEIENVIRDHGMVEL
jgi:hypothetical protein